MTLERLNNYRHLQKEIDELRRRIQVLKDEAESISVNLSGMPKGNSEDKLGRMVSEYLDLQAELENILAERIAEQKKIMFYINTKQDTRTRLIFYFRFVEGLKWESVAMNISAVETENNCKKVVERYIRNNF